MAELTFYEREVPILEAIHAREEAGTRYATDTRALAGDVGLDRLVVARATRSLIDGGFVEAADAGGYGGDDFLAPRLLPRGKATIGVWPVSPVDALVARLDQIIATTDDPDERGRLDRLRSAVGDVSKGAVASAIGGAAAQLGIGI